MMVGSVLPLKMTPTERGFYDTGLKTTVSVYSVDAVVFILIIKIHCLLGRIMERFAIANPPRASLAGIEMPPRGHHVEVRLCYP